MTERRLAGEVLPALTHSKQPVPQTCLCAGYRARLESLYRSESGPLRAWLVRRVGHEAADDLAHEVFLRAARCPQLDSLVNPRSFLRRIARNLVIDRARKKPRDRTGVQMSDTDNLACEPGQEEALHAQQTMTAFESSLAMLPARTALIFAMSRVEKKTYRQISAELKITTATVEYHMMRALRCIRSSLAEARGDRCTADQI